MSHNRIDLTGQRFGRLVVLHSAPRVMGQAARWWCRCECGTEKAIQGRYLRDGQIVSCGCRMRECLQPTPIQHGHARVAHVTGTYRSWCAMIQRCTNPKAPNYAEYGGRGIRVCERWLVFANFLKDMGERPVGTSLDRWPNANGNYEPGNCRWGTVAEQTSTIRRRTGRVRFFTLDDEPISVRAVEQFLAMSPGVYDKSLRRRYACYAQG